ncbi:FAD-NAD(P)-binding domain protein [Pseudomonas asturiensis]|uniref:FAD-NAD(P)-binding domain protein n=1 Tax=Pseudomonas asturiensis TaxID=1190415 RepID=A0ABX6HDH5_9PSED|nr:FAD-NAD(P)-binding domain protein [Pseudomonas asturiensis]
MQTLSLDRAGLPARQLESRVRAVAIIGMGSRGLSVLEQLIGTSRNDVANPLRIEVFDPRTPGSGLHLAEQPDYLMLNTMAGQLSAFSSAFPACEPEGWTFLQWCQVKAIRLDERGHVSADGQGRSVEFGDFVPRKLLGRYLQDSYRYLLRQCPAHVQVRHHAEPVTGCREREADGGFRVQTAYRALDVDAVLLTCGHSATGDDAQPVGESVLIEGLGLTAMDALAGLTQGRGGRYVRDPGFAGWRYLPSGREPKIALYSRSGLPFHARPQWHPSVHAALPRVFFTADALVGLRQQSTTGRLDFERDVLPLIKDEMRAVFWQAKVRLDAPRRLLALQQALGAARDHASRETLFKALAEQWGEFEPQQWLTTGRWCGDNDAYAQWFVQWIERDLAMSRLGTVNSPVRQALEVWRDYRDLLRAVADRNGLTEGSTASFYGEWAGLSNRLVGGPQKERSEDLLALIQAGVVTILPPMDDASCSPVPFDTLIRARVAHSGLSVSRDPLLNDLLRQGLIRPAHTYPADGIDTDPSGRALRSDGSAHARLWALGPAVEGCTFYNHYVPTPDPACRALIEARQVAEACLAALSASRFGGPSMTSFSTL